MAYKNIRGTAKRTCLCGNWLKHWRNNTGSSRKRCAVLGCGDVAEVGGHVVPVNGSSQYVIPMCRACNNLSDPFEIESTVVPVSANTQLMGCYPG